MYIIIGLGNPGRKYAATRHNIGFDAITRLSDDFRISLDMRRHQAIIGKGIISRERVILAQPQTYMNLSGECVRELMNHYKVPVDKIIVIHDDVNLEPGRIRIREKGSAGGHNGLKDIILHIGDEFTRIKIGVGDRPKELQLYDYVLDRFTEEENVIMRETLCRVSKACETILREDAKAAMNIYNEPYKPPVS